MGFYLPAPRRFHQPVRIGGFYPRSFRQDMSDRIEGLLETDAALRILNRIDPEDILSGTVQALAVSTQKIKAVEVYPVHAVFPEKNRTAGQRKKNGAEHQTERILFSFFVLIVDSLQQ